MVLSQCRNVGIKDGIVTVADPRNTVAGVVQMGRAGFFVAKQLARLQSYYEALLRGDMAEAR